MSSAARRFDPMSPGPDSKKRRRGAARLSCAECRRLKLRCDRNVPCGSCVKRGCGAICPDGALTTGQGNRFVLASTQELHEKISELANRVRELEDGLRTSHSQISRDTHPLLSEDLLKIKAPLQREPRSQRNGLANGVKEEEPSGPNVVDAIGSLSISEGGRTKYFGLTANSWYFLQNEFPEAEEADDRLTELRNVLPTEILAMTGSFPIVPTARPTTDYLEDRLRNLYWYLPDSQQATRLRDIYYHHAAWMYDPIPIQYFDPQVFFKIYNLSPSDASGSDTSSASADDAEVSHRLALMFIVLAIGSLMDVAQPAYNVEAEKYHQLARAALFQSQLFDEPSLQAVQALFLMSFYLFLADRHGTTAGSRWAIMGMAVKLAQSIGLHRDIDKWSEDATETQLRRITFWELYTYDSWQCMTFGRPPSFALAHVDCKLPYVEYSPGQTFHAWKHRFASECMSHMHDQAFGAKTPSYATVVQLDRKLRAFPVPSILQVAGFGSSSSGGIGVGSEQQAAGVREREAGSESVPLVLQRHIVLAIRETNLLYMHRSFFARALSDHPKDPLGSPYGTSVLAAYRSAGSLVALMRNLHSQVKDPTERTWFLWAHMFSCSIVLGSIVTRCPSMTLAPSALVQLDSACELFRKAARGFRAYKVLKIMLGLRDKAHYSLQAWKDGRISPTASRIGPPSEPPTPTDDADDDELAKLGGKTRVVARKDSANSPPMMRSPTSLNPVVPVPLGPLHTAQAHPNVLEYLRSFETPQLQVPTAPTTLSGAPLLSPLTATTSKHTSPTEGTYPQQQPQMVNMYGQDVSMASAVAYEPSGMMGAEASMEYTAQFPQYFPVFDYGPSADGGDLSGYAVDDAFGMGTLERQRESNSPENSMQVTWQDFVDRMAVGP